MNNRMCCLQASYCSIMSVDFLFFFFQLVNTLTLTIIIIMYLHWNRISFYLQSSNKSVVRKSSRLFFQMLWRESVEVFNSHSNCFHSEWLLMWKKKKSIFLSVSFLIMHSKFLGCFHKEKAFWGVLRLETFSFRA